MQLTSLQRKELHALESMAHAWAEQACNEEVSEATDEWRDNEIRQSLQRIIGFVPEGFFWNRDPRGYALKIDNDHPRALIRPGMATDWGGFGLLAHEETVNV